MNRRLRHRAHESVEIYSARFFARFAGFFRGSLFCFSRVTTDIFEKIPGVFFFLLFRLCVLDPHGAFRTRNNIGNDAFLLKRNTV